MEWLKTAAARRLAPDAFNQADRYQRLRSFLDDAQRWLGYEFPEVDEAIFWAKVSEVNHFRRLEQQAVEAVPGKPWIHSISDFREHLRAKRTARSHESERVKGLVEAAQAVVAATVQDSAGRWIISDDGEVLIAALADALSAIPGEAVLAPAPQPGGIRILDGRSHRFIEREVEGDKWEPLEP